MRSDIGFSVPCTQPGIRVRLIDQTIKDQRGRFVSSLNIQTLGGNSIIQIDERIKAFDRKITTIFKASDVCQRIAKIRGIGPKTATAMIAEVGDGSDFKNGRHLAAWLGLVPRQHSSGDRRVMMGISKRGSQHLRTLLVHGARAVVRTAVRKNDSRSRWLNELRQRRGYNRATVAVANKNARVIWAVLTSGEPYRPAA